MTTVFDAAHEIADSAVEQLKMYDGTGGITVNFSLDGFIQAEIDTYCQEDLIMSADIVSLWQSLGWPESETMGVNIMVSMRIAIRECISEHSAIRTHIESTIRLWVSDEILRREIKDAEMLPIQIDTDTTEELVRALA